MRATRAISRSSSFRDKGHPSPADEASIDQKIDPRAEGCGSTDQKYGRSHQFVYGRHPSERRIGLELAHLLGDLRPYVHRRRSVSRAYRVDADSTVAPFHREALREVDHSRLGAVVVGLKQTAIDDD